MEQEPQAGPSTAGTSREASSRRVKKSKKSKTSGRILKKNSARPSYAKYLYKIMRERNPTMTISVKAMDIMDDMMHDVFNRIAKEAGELIGRSKMKTMTERDIKAAVMLLLPGDLGQFATANAAVSLNKFYGTSSK